MENIKMENIKIDLMDVIKDEIMERLKDGELDGIYVSDAMMELYNNDYYIIGTYKAEEFLKENFDYMLDALEEYQNEFGEAYKDITNTELVATLSVLYVASQIWNELDTVSDYWDMTIDDIINIDSNDDDTIKKLIIEELENKK